MGQSGIENLQGARRFGIGRAWVIFTLVILVVAMLVVIFVRNLPKPPRYDPLTIDPGSTVPARPPFGMRLELGEGANKVTRSWRASTLEVEGTPVLPAVLAREIVPGDRWRLIVGLDVDLAETTIFGLQLEVADVEYVIRAFDSEIASDRAGARKIRRLPDFLIPAGSRRLEFEISPAGPSPLFRGTWIGEDGMERPLGDVSETTSASDPISDP